MAKTKRISERRLERILSNVLDRVMSHRSGGWAETFEEAEICTYNRGVVVHIGNGQEFQITIVESARG